MDIKYGRKRSGIRRELKKKIEEWLDTIDNVDIQAAARNDVIVTGGSIASMLLGDPVNDFDVYFRTKETTKLVADYYVNKFKAKNKKKKVGENVKDVEIYTKEEQIENIKGEWETRVVIYIKSVGLVSEDKDDSKKETPYRYFESMGEDAVADYVESELKERAEDDSKEKYRPVFLSQNAITLSNKIQLVIRFYGEPDKIHSNYDFVHATSYWDHKKEVLNIPAEAMESLLSRTLVYRGSLYPVASIFRTKKFLERGWRISAGEQLKMMWQISEIDLTDIHTIREQLTGVDMAYLWEVIEVLSKENKDKINSTYIAEIIDRIFN